VHRSHPAGTTAQAQEFLAAADLVGDIADAHVTLCVHAGIAASDVICCIALGEHAQGENHSQAIALLKTADKAAARHLSTLLALKTKSGYSRTAMTTAERTRAGRAAGALLEAARRAQASAGR